MCGICGKFVFSGSQAAPITEHEIDQMCRMIVHRGPDGQGIRVDRQCGIGMRRLAIIDIESGQQPMANEDATVWVVFNGEIYNFQQLRRDLQRAGHTFKTDSDTEVLVHLYEEYGDACVEKCNGMFAFCIYDSRRQRLYLARDRVGKKPLYYYSQDNTFWFASELKSLFINPKIPRQVNPQAIVDFLTFGFIGNPATAFQNIQQLEPAHYLIVDQAGIKKRRYWSLENQPHRPITLAEAEARYIDLLGECVKDRVIADVPVGLLLSGGIDSCSVAAMMAKQQITMPTFTIRFDDAEKDEGAIARRMADAVGAENKNRLVEIGDVADLLPTLVWHYEQPFGDSSAIPTYYVSKIARQDVTVVLNGDGGDESFGGYWRHLFNVWLHRVRWLPTFSWKLLETIATGLPQRHLSPGSQRLLRWLSWSSQASQKELLEASWFWLSRTGEGHNNMLSSAFSQLSPNAPGQLRAAWDGYGKMDYLNRVLCVLDLNFHLVDALLVKMDRATMANSLEARSPFLDYRMIEFAASLPPAWKVRRLTTKWFPKFVGRHFLPPEVLKKRKTGFGIPLRKWMNGELGDSAWKVVLSDRAIERGYFDKQALLNLSSAHRAGKIDSSYLLYNLLFLELWHRSFIDDFTPAPDASIWVN